ncbi:hypothetical protein G6F57_002883 [Rhizopus arrhizus]|uniref:RlpA-like double-psi beta-barrel-protein domain-containing protein-containing protein n=1 Tax=Rhizopus oryzae TaxID=64495 RepID=A0A9P7BVG0_RHIOR|nr:hypothetical protein G6F23_000867 [Rhizopus arrhizus]KAG1428465.1 hypothetical protein G6F58_000550 [Rhizopus delemar]KAG0767792.1 hypothetical protein G6F24_002493 [Rhizopus arrhizus]KAG0797432.1 hypothetical protein G6F21_000530 [Rhizopus arrhizus]KAG0800826.1 hypothetical protein G6F22_001846 [Rhizopus arrhizus]
MISEAARSSSSRHNSTVLSSDQQFQNLDHPFGLMQDEVATERDPLIVPPPTVWTNFNEKYRFGKLILVAAGCTGIVVVMLAVLGGLGVYKNVRYRNEAGISSIGKTKYKGDSWGSATSEGFTMGGQGDGTYYDPGVGLTSCGGQFTASDMIVALNSYDYGNYADPNQSPVCGACIIVTGPLGAAKATIQDMCPSTGCGRGSLDLSPAVFSQVGDLTEGRIAVNWTHC